MKKLCVLLLSGALLLSSCQSLPASPVQAEQEVVELTLAIPKNSSSILREVAQELARRAEDFAQNSLTISIVEKNNIWTTVEQGTVDLVICENSRLLKGAADVGELSYPEYPEPVEGKDGTEETRLLPQGDISGGAAMLAMLEYPYFFRDGECVLGGVNDPQIMAALNHSLPEGTDMELKRISYCGRYHWLTADGEALDAYLMDKDYEDVLLAQINDGRSIEDPWGQLEASGISIREVDLGEKGSDLSGKTLLLSGGRQKLLDIFVLPKSLEALNKEQKAALEEAIVYSGGYSRTLADDLEKSSLEQLTGAAVNIMDVDVDEWYEAFQHLYRSGNYELNEELVELLWDKCERFH